MKKHLIILALLVLVGAMNAAVLLTDDFTGTVGTYLTENGWTAHSGAGTTPLSIASPGLTYTGYSGSGVGNATSASVNGEDVNKTFTSTNSGSVYYSFMFNTATTYTTVNYPMHMIQSGTTYPAKFHFVLQSGAVKFGISKFSNTPVYDSGSYSTHTTYLIVVRYTFNTGSTTDDVVSLWINPTLGGAEPTPNVSVTETASTDATALTAIALRQYNAATLARFDGIIVGTAWSDIAGATLATEPTAQPTNLQFSNVTSTTYDVAFTAASPAPEYYLAVRKADSAPTTDPVDGTGYTAGNTLGDGVIAYAGSGTSFSEASLNPSTTYYYKVYSYNGTGASANYLLTSPLAGNQATSAGVVLPTVTTTAITAITNNSAYSGGNVTADGGGTITARGVCWNTTGSPSLNDDFTVDGTGVGAFTSFIDGIAAAQLYYVRAYATNSAGDAYGEELSFTTLKAEPSLHVTSFTAGTTTASSIPLTWTDAAKVTPDGYLIKGSDVGYTSIIAPTDGVPETNGLLVRNVTQGTQNYTFTGLNYNTPYYFQIYPYTNSGTGIDYKTDGTVPQTTATTQNMTVLNPGDIAILGMQVDTPDQFAFITFVDIAAGTEVRFTDNGWTGTALNTTEGTLTWTAPAGGIPAGTVVVCTVVSNVWTTDTGTITNNTSFALATAGDQIIVYQGASTSPSLIYCISTLPWVTTGAITSNTTYLPTGLTDGYTAWALSTEYDDLYYTDATIQGSQAEVLALLADEANWTLSNDLLTFPEWEYDDEPLPVVLSSFTATFSNDMYVKLTWITQSETNMTGYYVLRSQNNNLVNAQTVSPLIGATNTSSTQTYEFTDRELYETGTYYYWLEMNEQGNITYAGPLAVDYQNNNVPPAAIPTVTSLNAIFPNPFNPVAYIPFSISDKGAQNVQILIYNSRGQIVFTDDLGTRNPGNHTDYFWNGKDSAGQDCSTGIYFIRMIAGKDSFLRKAVMIK